MYSLSYRVTSLIFNLFTWCKLQYDQMVYCVWKHNYFAVLEFADLTSYLNNFASSLYNWFDTRLSALCVSVYVQYIDIASVLCFKLPFHSNQLFKHLTNTRFWYIIDLELVVWKNISGEIIRTLSGLNAQLNRQYLL